MHYDFVEIGTANFWTLTQECSDNTRGIAIEPIQHYLNQLPNKPLVTKLNCAISPNNQHGDIEVYYIPEEVIDNNNLPWWLKGCNSVGDYHRFHLEYNIQNLVKIEKVSMVPISFIFAECQITSLDFLKIDTEGNDGKILTHLYTFLQLKDRALYPKKIRYETSHSNRQEQESVLQLYSKLGYIFDYTDIDDTQIILP